jgi:hypothetical protein
MGDDPSQEMAAEGDDDGEDPERFLRFHQLASARKVDLASRGLPVPNTQIEDLFQQAEEMDVKSEAWPSWLREQLASPREGEPCSHPLIDMTRRMRDAMHGDADVNVYRLIKLVRAFIVIIERLGRFASISITEAVSNVGKIEDGIAAASETGRGGSLIALLRSEVNAGMHGKGGILQDPSAAMGVLWIARFLMFWQEICHLRSQPLPPSGESIPLALTIDGAYKHLLLPYHG